MGFEGSAKWDFGDFKTILVFNVHVGCVGRIQ